MTNPAVNVTLNADGSHSLTIPGANGTTRVSIDWTSGRSFTMTTDVNADGVIDDQRTVTTTSGTTTSLWQVDRSLAGAFDWKNTVTRTSSVTTSTVEEILPLGGTTFVTTSEFTDSAFDLAGPKCIPPQLDGTTCTPNGADSVAPKPTFCAPPSTTPTGGPCGTQGQPACITWIPDGQTWTTAEVGPSALLSVPQQSRNKFYFMTEGAMLCTPEQAAQLTSVVTTALGDIDDTMIDLNIGKWAQLLMALTNTPLYFGCSLPATAQGRGIVAVTQYADFSDDPNDAIMITAIDPSIFTAGDNALEEIITHEWFHVAGDSHPHDPNGWAARDQIYSCARSINQGKAFSDGFYLGVCCDASSARDHATCADADNKEQFGIQNMFVETTDGIVESPNSGLTSYTNNAPPKECVAMDNTPPAPCGCTLESVPAYCDQTLVTEQEALGDGIFVAASTLTEPNCCESCPSATPYTTACPMVSPTSPAICEAATSCAPLPQPGANVAAGPTPPLRNPAASVVAGQALWSSDVMGSAINCPALPGYAY